MEVNKAMESIHDIHIDNLWRLVYSNGGFTASTKLRTINNTSGYIASMAGYETVIPLQVLTYDVFSALVLRYRNMANIRGDNANIGTWESDGKLYFDISFVFNDLSSALKFAEDNNQLAVWDIANNCEIKVK